PMLINREQHKMDDCKWLPTATTTWWNSWIESCSRVSRLEASARTTCVSCPFMDWTLFSCTSMPRTWVPDFISSKARDWPKRPRPITATESAFDSPLAPFRKLNSLANGRPFLREFVECFSVAQGQCGTQREDADTAEIH